MTSEGLTKVVNTNGTFYLVNDGLGSVGAGLDASGTLTSTQLFVPYGTTRYSSGDHTTRFFGASLCQRLDVPRDIGA